MRIFAPTLQQNASAIRLSARVQTETPMDGQPETLWFEYPASQERWVAPGSEGFVVAMLLPAMALGENIQVCGPLSSELVQKLEAYQTVFHRWFPNWLRPVQVCGEEDRTDSPVTTGVATTFSGGVDSFYTLYTRLPETGQERPITYALFVHGFDIPLTDEATFALAAREYGAMTLSLGLQLLIAKTNLRQMLAGVSWELAHGTALIGAALTLSRAFSRLYIPGTYPADEAHPWGSDYRTDPLLSTRMLEIVHDGADLTRVDKIRAIANWSETFGRLRVCWKKPDGLKNCCRCSKCLRTMITLEMLGALPNYTTFPLPLERRAIRTCRFTVVDFPFIKPILECPEAARRPDLAADLRLALRISRLRVLGGTILRRLGLRR